MGCEASWLFQGGVRVWQGGQKTCTQPRSLQVSWFPVLSPFLNVSTHIQAGMLRLGSVPALRTVPVLATGLPMWAFLKDPQRFLVGFTPLELAVVPLLEGTLGQP